MKARMPAGTTIFSEEALKAQDGKKTPLTWGIGGPVIGEATMKYDPETGNLMGEFRVDDLDAAKQLGQLPPAIIFRKE